MLAQCTHHLFAGVGVVAVDQDPHGAGGVGHGQMVLVRRRPYLGARAKTASAAAVAVAPIMPNLFQPRSNWDRSTLVSPEIRIEPSSSSVIVTGRGSAAVMPLMVKFARRSAALPSVGCTAVTTTLISPKRSTSKKSAERRCVSRRPMPVLSDAVRMSRRPKTAPLPVSCPSPLKSVKRPLTFSRPHMFLILKVMAERPGTMFHTPAMSGSLSSVSKVVIVASFVFPPGLIHQGSDPGRVAVFVDPVDQAVNAHLDHDADPQRDRLAGMAGGVQDVLLNEAAGGSVVEQLAVQDLVATLGRDVDEPVDDPQRAGLVVV